MTTPETPPDPAALADRLTDHEIRLLMELTGHDVLFPVGHGAAATVAAEHLKGRKLATIDKRECGGRQTLTYRATPLGAQVAAAIAERTRPLCSQ